MEAARAHAQVARERAEKRRLRADSVNHAKVLDQREGRGKSSFRSSNHKKKNTVAGAATQTKTLIPAQVLALCFDNIGIICDISRPIWLSEMQPQLDSFLRKAVFPALALGTVDEQLWAKDPDL